MRTLTHLSIVVACLFLVSSCAKVFYAPDAYALAHNQENFAIIPPTISIAASKKVDADAIVEQQKTESLNFQKEMYAWMLKRKMQRKITQEVQETETTNALLKRAGYPENPFTSAELCEILGVDGIMTSNYALSKPISEGASIAMAIFGSDDAANEVRVSISINDCSTKVLIWNYDHKYSGGLDRTHARLVNEILRDASERMPYMRR